MSSSAGGPLPSAEPVTPTEVSTAPARRTMPTSRFRVITWRPRRTEGTCYAVGGRRLEVTARSAAVQRFDLNADRWTELPVMPGKVSAAAWRSSAAG